LEKIEVEFGDILLYTEVMWLSSSIVLRIFFNLRAEIEIFINEESKSVHRLSAAEWILDLSFLVDITSLLNELKMELRGKENFSLFIFRDNSFQNEIKID
jgi:hypothetical protein